jgi:hypothetical protein
MLTPFRTGKTDSENIAIRRALLGAELSGIVGVVYIELQLPGH